VVGNMKVIIAGSRNTYIERYIISAAVRESNFNVTEVVCGGAPGVDRSAEKWAEFHGVKCTVIYADWDRYAEAAGPIRNAQMAKYADALIAFPGGKGTKNMIKTMMGLKKPVYEVRH
jgi:predicted Rossmann-fold nucleotide-binding protein